MSFLLDFLKERDESRLGEEEAAQCLLYLDYLESSHAVPKRAASKIRSRIERRLSVLKAGRT